MNNVKVIFSCCVSVCTFEQHLEPSGEEVAKSNAEDKYGLLFPLHLGSETPEVELSRISYQVRQRDLGWTLRTLWHCRKPRISEIECVSGILYLLLMCT